MWSLLLRENEEGKRKKTAKKRASERRQKRMKSKNKQNKIPTRKHFN